MDPEAVIQREVRQKEKNKYHIITHICGISKNGTDETYLQSRKRYKDIDNKCMDQGGKKWGGGG